MRFLKYLPEKLERDPEFEILLLGDEDSCQVLEEMVKHPENGLKKMTALFDRIITRGIEDIQHDKNKIRHLQKKIFELKRGPKKGPKFRVFAFRDRYRIVCIEANPAKKDDNVDPFVSRAEAERRKYLSARESGKLLIQKVVHKEDGSWEFSKN